MTLFALMNRLSRRARFHPLVACALAVGLVAALGAAASGEDPQVPPPQVTAISAQALSQIQALVGDKASRTDAQNRIDSHLLFKQKRAQGLLPAGLQSVNLSTTTAADGREIVDVTAERASELVQEIQRLGADVLFADARMLRLRVSLDALETLAGLPGVIFIQPPQYPQLQSVIPRMTNDEWTREAPARLAGHQAVLANRLRSALSAQQPQAVVAVDSEGDTTHKAITARATFGVNGVGIKVGVLSSGVDGLAASQAAGALGPVMVLPGQEGTGNEGTAMLEIVHDLAPGAQLYFATAFSTNTQFATNIRALQAAGCKIIVDDVSYSNESPFQDGQTASVISTGNAGVLAQAVKDVAAAGVLYFSSAANSGSVDAGTSGTWEGDFKNSGFTFDAGNGRIGIAHQFGIFAGLPFPANYLNSPGTDVNLSWSDPLGGSSNDYDLYILDGTTGAVKDFSINTQNGTQDPFEQVTKQLAAGDEIVVVKYSGSTRYLHVDTGRGVLYFATAGSTHGHAATTAANSFGVASTPANPAGSNKATCVAPAGPYPNPFSATNRVECSSSDGPRRIFFKGDGSAITPNNFLEGTNGGQVLLKPDLTAADGVAVSGAGYDATKPLDNVKTPFFGTSAAAPHAAAIAALVWSRNLSQTPSRVKAALLGSAIDIMAPGIDRDSGAGIIMAEAAVVAAPPGPRMSLDKTSLFFSAINTGAAFGAKTSPQTVRLTQTGAGTVTWTAVSTTAWLVVAPTSGSGSTTLTISTQFAAGLAASQTGSVTVTFTGAANLAGPITVTLASLVGGTTAAPTGSFDTPIDRTTGVTGSIAVTGWAMDDIEVTGVRILRDPVAGEPAGTLVLVGNAVLVDGARPDVQVLFPTSPRNTRAGWGYLMLTNFLPGLGNGTFKLYAIADDADGHSTVLGTKTITCTNSTATAPTGAIDTPAQGGTVSGSNVTNFGWVLSPNPRRADPPGAGVVRVAIDGAFISAVPSGWTSRSDLTALFPASQFPGIATALGVAGFDSTALSNGVHTISWVVTDNLGSASGIGSRYFTVSNGSLFFDPTQGSVTASDGATVIQATASLTMPGAAALRFDSPGSLTSDVDAAPGDGAAIHGRRGFILDTPLQAYAVRGGRATVQAEELDRIELYLSGTPGHRYAGYLRVGDSLTLLPIGSSLNASTGAFTWMPGVGFVGTYDLVFVRWSGAQAVARQDVRIVLNPKGSNRVGPQTVIDTPSSAQGTAVVGSSFVLAGWAADLDATGDRGVDTVHVWAYPATGDDPIWIGAATYGGARPDVAAIYGDRFLNTGYGLTVQGLAPGTYDLALFAYSTVTGGFVPAKAVRVTVR